jgi:hypothetical protein
MCVRDKKYSMNVKLSRLTSAAAALLPLITSLFAAAVVSTTAEAQVPTPTQEQSQANPFPKANGNTQNRGRASDDKYWGILDDNFLWNQAPMARIPNQNGLELIGLSGWTYPQAVNNTATGDGRLINLYGDALSNYTNPGITLDNVVPPATVPGAAAPPLTPFPLTPAVPGSTNSGGLWVIATGPSDNPTGADYSRTPAVPRPTAAAVDYIANNPTAAFSWYPNVPGDANVVRRYAIRVILPNIVDNDAENRISDARYTVFYSFRDRAGTIQYRSKVCFVSQASDSTAGAKYLSETQGGTPAYFPFFSDASYGVVTGLTRRSFVVLDNTTGDDPTTDATNNAPNQFVIADALQLEQRVAIVSATPTLTPVHGGRKINPANVTVGQRQPAGGPNYKVGDNGAVTGVAGGIIMPNSAYGASTATSVDGLGNIIPTPGFIGDPRDPEYSGNPNDFSVLFMGPESYARPKVLPDEYTGQYPFARTTGSYSDIPQPGSPIDNDPLTGLPNGIPIITPVTPVGPTVLPTDPWESVGTRRQLDPAAALAGPTLPAIPIQRVSANNFQVYRTNANEAPDYNLLDPATANKPVPLFSQVQVILARTVFVPDPETGVRNSDLDGTRTIEVGEVLGLDWQTGAVIWRFPDRTYLPEKRAPFQPLYNNVNGVNVAVPNQGIRNPVIGYEKRPVYSGTTISTYVDILQRPINLIPGIQGYDLDGNGVIDDTEVFIAPQGENSSGGLGSSVTLASQVPVQGDVTIPVYDANNVVPPPYVNTTPVLGVSTNVPPDGGIIGVIPAPAGRYKTAGNGPILTTVAYVASNNGVIYAFDPYGNNDNAYTEQEFNNTVTPVRTPRRLGRFRPGTTNVLWTFNANSVPRLRAGDYISNPVTLPLTQNESVEQYNKRLFGEVPATLGFGGASPTIAYRKDENDPAVDRLTEEPRLFIGNQNGVMYALDASAKSVPVGTDPIGKLPFHKGEQPANTYYGLPPLTIPGLVANIPADSRYRLDLKWWFETEAQSEIGGGAINATAAVSTNRMQAGTISALATTPALVEKGVYFTSAAGRVYCVDWTGPVSKEHGTLLAQTIGHDISFIWNGADPSSANAQLGFPAPPPTGEQSVAYAASQNLNDNYRFHNQRAATNTARADNTEGKIRPRWVYPSQYIDTVGTGYKPQTQPNLAESVTPIVANTFRDTVTAPIYGAPTLIDFPWTNPANGNTTIRHLVAFLANDRGDGDTAPASAKAYLLDQAGDRRDFLTNPQTVFGTPRRRAYSSPLDQYAILNEAVGRATPAWTYRSQYGTYDNQGNLIIQNTADFSISLNHGTKALGLASDANALADYNAIAQSQPSRRVLPTLFFGSTGRMYGIDFDIATGLFTRWRAGTGFGSQPVPLPVLSGAVRTDLIPQDIANTNPNNEMVTWVNPDLTTSSAGNLRFRPILARTVPLFSDPSPVDGSITITGGPLQTRNSYISGGFIPEVQTSPAKPTNDPPVLSPPGVGITVTANFGTTRFQTTPGSDISLTTDRAVNQEIDDPLATTRGSLDPETTGVGVVEAGTDGLSPVGDRSFQFPTMFVTTAGASNGINPVGAGGLYEVSTNLDGEDAATIGTPPTSSLGTFDPQTSARGWGFTTDLLRFNNSGHVFQLGVAGPGGSGSGVSVLTPAYFPAMDPSLTGYITGEPAVRPGTLLITEEGFGGIFNPLGVAALNATAPNTSQTGLPLDVNGLYFDKNSAIRRVNLVAGDPSDPAEPYVSDRWRWGGKNVLITDPTDDDGQIALPSYSKLALRVDPFTTVLSETNANELADGIRPDYTRYGSTDPVGNPDLRNNDDVNPTAQNTVWIFAGGPEGALYAYTPALPRRFGGDGGSGLAGGTPISDGNNPFINGQPKIEIIDASRVAGLIGGSTRPDRLVDSVIGQNHKNFYEWGETVYIAVYDVAKTAPPASRRFPFRRNPSQDVTVEIADNNGRVIQTLTGRLGAGSYAPQANFFPGTTPPGGTTAADYPQLGVAIIRYRLNQGSAQTPGTILRAQLPANTQQTIINRTTGNRTILAAIPGGANDAQIVENAVVPFQIANPLAILSFIKDTQGNPSLPAGANTNRTANSIGPFRTSPAAKNLVATAATAATALPDNTNAFYSQALSNGNEIRRYEISPYSVAGGNIRPVRNVNRRITPNDPTFYVPVVAGIGFGDHGKTATSDANAGQRYLRIANRSLLSNLRGVRVQVRDDIIWRTWPGTIPNDDATDGGTLADGTPTTSGGGNPRLTPNNGGTYQMRTDGIVNFLPWEQPVPEVQPWKRSTIGNGTAGAGGNSSQDYPDILARAQGALDSQVVSVKINGVDLAAGQGSLLANASATTGVNTSISANVLQLPFASVDAATADASQTILRQAAASLSVKIPKFQPANLVAMHTTTSTYLAPNANNDETGATQVTTGGGDVQLPQLAADRRISSVGNNGLPSGNPVISPFGYTTRLRVYIDSNNNGQYDDTEAFRDVETWLGVAVDQSLSANEKSPVEITGPTGGLAMGFGMQNGFLGYGQGTGAFPQGLLPAPLFSGTFQDSPYKPFFASFAVKNSGNVNMWDLRAAQRASSSSTGSPTAFYQLRSTTVDPLQGIFSFGADPGLGVMPQVVTSLDANLDTAWDAFFQSGSAATNPLLNSIDPATTGAPTIYQQYYAGLGGKHTLHKPRVGDPVDSGTLLSIPDVPSAQPLSTNLSINLAPSVPVISVAVPIGTPSGTYGPVDNAPADFYVFEDHDTQVPYSAVPLINGGVISPAGPLYAGQNLRHPGAASILPASGAGILRPRTAATATANAELLPRTDPGIRIKVKVVEGAATGQIPDQALGAPNTTAVTTGILPFIDQLPLYETTTQGNRPAAALSPAAYRDAVGSLHVFFSRNANNGAAVTAPGSAYNLFSSSLLWDTGIGQWKAAQPGSGPIATSIGAAPGGQWFTAPAPVPTGTTAVGSSNTSPFVLQQTVNGVGGDASLFFLNTAVGTSGRPVREIYTASLAPDGNGGVTIGTPSPLLLNPDPSLQRFGPRAALDVDPNSGNPLTTFTFYYGGVAGKWTLYYTAADPGVGGLPAPATANRRERALSLPLSIISASDPVPVTRTIIEPVTNTVQRVVDLYYAGTSRTDKAPNIYMTRYVIDRSGESARLNAQSLVPRTKEVLSATSGSGLYKAKDIAWVRDGNPARLPQIFIYSQNAPATDPTRLNPVTDSTRWAYDDTTNLLYQRFQRAAGQSATFVYVDVSAGTVRFRGQGAPSGSDVVAATYVPQTYRLTLDGAASTAVTGFYDNRPLLDSATENGLIQQTNQPENYIVRRPTNTLVAGRTWLIWNQSAKGASAAGLQMLTRRVGADLKTTPRTGDGLSPRTDNPESIALDRSTVATPDNKIQVPRITNITIDGNPVPGNNYEVDAANGRIYVDPMYEGHTLSVTYLAQPGANGAPVGRTAVYDLAQISDLDPSVPTSNFAGQGVPMQRSVNENQPYAFLDRYDPRLTTTGRAAGAPPALVDPITQPGKVWLFWTSPRSRTGVLRSGITPDTTTTVNGFDVYWQTLAPFFDFSSYKP